MRVVLAALPWLAACSFQAGQLPQAADDAGNDTPSGDGRMDAVAGDAMADMQIVSPSTTNHTSVADTYVADQAKNLNLDGEPSALVDGSGNFCVVLMRFDLASIPTGATVSAAELHVWTADDGGDSDVMIYPVLQSWVESEATWNNRSNGTGWTAPGVEPPSRGAVIIGTITPTATNTEYITAITTSTVQGWVTSPATNVGIAFVTQDSNGTRFATRENVTAAVRPYLRVTHTP